MYTLNRLDNSFVGYAYQSFTFPLYRSYLKLLKPKGLIIAIGALVGEQKPVGLALAEIIADGASANLLSIFVTQNYRNRGIGTALLTRLEAELGLRGCNNVKLIYTTSNPQATAFERVIQKRNWLSPTPRHLVCKCDHRNLDAPWLDRDYRLPSSFTLFPWKEITTKERNLLHRQQQTEQWIPPELVPFRHEDNLETFNSFGLRYQNEVVGWILTHRLAPDTIRYTCAYIRPDLQKLAQIICLYQKSIKLHTTRLDIPHGIWTVPFRFKSHVRFILKRFGPYMDSIEESRESSKSLTGSLKAEAFNYRRVLL